MCFRLGFEEISILELVVWIRSHFYPNALYVNYITYIVINYGIYIVLS